MEHFRAMRRLRQQLSEKESISILAERVGEWPVADVDDSFRQRTPYGKRGYNR